MAKNNILNFESSSIDYSNECLIYVGTENDIDVYNVSKEEKNEFVLLTPCSIPMSEATDVVRSVIRKCLKREPMQYAEFMRIVSDYHNATYKIIVI